MVFSFNGQDPTNIHLRKYLFNINHCYLYLTALDVDLVSLNLKLSDTNLSVQLKADQVKSFSSFFLLHLNSNKAQGRVPKPDFYNAEL